MTQTQKAVKTSRSTSDQLAIDDLAGVVIETTQT
jgi:hypothetical protein